MWDVYFVCRNLLLGLACNESTIEIELDMSCNSLGAQGAHVLESCIHGIRCIGSLDISENSKSVYSVDTLLFSLLHQNLEHPSASALCPLACKCYERGQCPVCGHGITCRACQHATHPTILTQPCHFLPLPHCTCSFSTFFISHFFDIDVDFQECNFHLS